MVSGAGGPIERAGVLAGPCLAVLEGASAARRRRPAALGAAGHEAGGAATGGRR